MKQLKPISKSRHWKQRFDPNCEMVFRRDIRYGDKQFKKGSDIPEQLYKDLNILRRYWNIEYIELKYFGDYVKPEIKIEKSVKKTVKSVKKTENVTEKTD